MGGVSVFVLCSDPWVASLRLVDGDAFSLGDVKLLIALTDGMRYAYFCDKVRCIQLIFKM